MDRIKYFRDIFVLAERVALKKLGGEGWWYYQEKENQKQRYQTELWILGGGLSIFSPLRDLVIAWSFTLSQENSVSRVA